MRITHDDLVIHVKNLRLRTIIGVFDWERKIKQDIVINYSFTIDGSDVRETDSIESTVDYKSLTKQIIDDVERSDFYLLEKLAQHVLDHIMRDDRIREATVEVDKPNALHYADSVSVLCRATRER